MAWACDQNVLYALTALATRAIGRAHGSKGVQVSCEGYLPRLELDDNRASSSSYTCMKPQNGFRWLSEYPPQVGTVRVVFPRLFPQGRRLSPQGLTAWGYQYIGRSGPICEAWRIRETCAGGNPCV